VGKGAAPVPATRGGDGGGVAGRGWPAPPPHGPDGADHGRELGATTVPLQPSGPEPFIGEERALTKRRILVPATRQRLRARMDSRSQSPRHRRAKLWPWRREIENEEEDMGEPPTDADVETRPEGEPLEALSNEEEKRQPAAEEGGGAPNKNLDGR